jgi:hypothetical protein
MKLALLCIAGAVLLFLLLFWGMTQIHFRIGSRHLKVLLFGVPIRRLSLANIAYVSKREPKGFAERWYSTLKTSHRLLTVERKRGIIRNVCITPQNRYVFLADLKSAVRRVDPTAEWAALRTYGDAALANQNESLAEQEQAPAIQNESSSAPGNTDPN